MAIGKFELLLLAIVKMLNLNCMSLFSRDSDLFRGFQIAGRRR